MAPSDQSSGALARLGEWLSKPALDTSPTYGPQITRFGLLVVLTILATVFTGAIYLVP